MRQITVTEALNELKLYDSKINKGISNLQVVAAAKKSSSNVGVKTKDIFCKNAMADYQSVIDLIENRNKIKSAIVKSNAIKEVTINNKTMTVAEAIERKNSIEYEKLLLNKIRLQYTSEYNIVLKENKRVDSKVDELIATLVGKDTDKKLSKDDQENVERPYREKNEFDLVDPLDISEKIKLLETEIDGFLSEVDTALSVVNATTVITVD